jgi:hypothetical protein
MPPIKLLALPALLLLPGCTALDVVSAPVKVLKTGGKVVDVMTTSQSERDEKRGREIRRREERVGELQREYQKQSRKCEGGKESACRKAAQARAELRSLMPQVPYEQD